MKLGKQLFRLSRFPTALVASILIGAAAAAWVLSSPRSSVEIASATTQALLDTPKSSIVDARQDAYTLEGLTKRSVLVGNIVASAPVRERIAREAEIPLEAVQVSAPLTPEQPRELGGERGPTDLAQANDQYRLAVRANPTVPVLTFFAQAPSAAAAERLANAGVSGLRDYLDDTAQLKQTPDSDRIRVLQLGTAGPSGVVDPGARWQLALVVFVIAFALSSGVMLALRRVRAGYRDQMRLERGAGRDPV